MESNVDHSDLLSNLQANILKPHGREYSWCVFIEFENNDPIKLRECISDYSNQITSALEQHKNTNAYKEYQRVMKKNKEDWIQKDEEAKQEYEEKFIDEVITNLALSSNGFTKIGIGLQSQPKDISFHGGMRSLITQNVLKDRIDTEWENLYKQNIDAVIIIAHNSEESLNISLEKIKSSFDGFGKIILSIERGKKLYQNGKKNGLPIEHFGFPDGLSQPVFWDEDENLIEKNLKLVLVKGSEYGFGSYLVFRKLEQNVEAFNKKIRHLAKFLYGNDDPIHIAKSEAQVVGRFKEDGTPLTLFDSSVGNNKSKQLRIDKFNRFNPDPDDENDPQTEIYEKKDQHGLKCPFHAHIRKVNPRSSDPEIRYLPYGDGDKLYDDGNEGKIEARIVRRGYPYDYWNDGQGRRADLTDEPNKDVGLLFMSYQASIRNQFERISSWCNSKTFPSRNITGGDEAGTDPIIGQLLDKERPLEMVQQWNSAYNDKNVKKKNFGFSGVVKSKGGEYFFAPSISFLKELRNLNLK